MHTHSDDDSETEITPYTCSDCKRTVRTRDLPVECDFCENLYCFKCSKIESKETYKTFGSKDDGMLWFCNRCRVSFKGVKKMLFTVSKLEQKQEQTRTHSMARHRKSPRSRRNLMVIDPLTPSQGH